MVTVSAVVKKLISEKPLLQEGLRQGIINYAALAESIGGQIRQQLGTEASSAAVIMALRRHSETIQEAESKPKLSLNTQLTLKTGLVYFSVKRSPQLFRKLEGLYRAFDYESGDTFNVIQGNSEVSIVANDKHEKKIAAALQDENVTTKEKNLVSISVEPEKDFVYTPGVLFSVTRKLYWDNINIFEIVTTATELNFIFQKKDAMRAYSSMQELLDEKKN